ncbi:MAG: RecB family exonuclease [Acidimicrobiia bacterium]
MATFADIPRGDDISVSATLFVTFIDCPQQALARLQGVYPQPTIAMFRGSLAHRIFARHLTDGPIADAELDAVCRSETGAHLNAQMSDVGLTKPSDFGVIVEQVREMYDRFRGIPTDGFDGAEVTIEHEVADDITLKGRVDAVFNDADGVRIVDWKTGSYLGSTKVQLDFYALAWTFATGATPSRTEAVSLSTGEKLVYEPTEGDLVETEGRLAAMIQELRAAMVSGAELARTGGPHCAWCPLLDTCDEGQSAAAVVSGSSIH